MIRSHWLHVILFSIYPAVFLVSANLGKTELSSASIPTAILLFGALAFTFLTTVGFESREHAAVFTTTSILLVFSFGHVLHVIPFFPLKTESLLVLWVAGFFLTIFFLLRHPARPINLTRWLNVVGLVLVGSTIVQIGYFFLGSRGSPGPIPERQFITTTADSTTSQPDVYYIILDRYGNEGALKSVYYYEDQAFLDQLEARGFVINRRSSANYLDTSHSLPSTLNLAYLNDLPGFPEENSNQWNWLYDRLENNSTLEAFNTLGYTTVHVGSWWGVTRRNKNVDIVVDSSYVSDFAIELYRTTILSALTERLGLDIDFLRSLDLRKTHFDRFNQQMGEIAAVASIEGSTYTFAHVLMPHSPYVFKADGSFRTKAELSRDGIPASFADQIAYLHIRLNTLLDQLMNPTDGPPPIIILQADEGPYPLRFQDEDHSIEDLNWIEATEDELRSKLGIVNAWFVPEEYGGPITPPNSSVNTFRVLFSQVFHKPYELLLDQAFLHETNRTPYRFRDISSLMPH